MPLLNLQADPLPGTVPEEGEIDPMATENAGQPVIPLRATSLILTPDLEQRMVERALTRKDELELEMGRDVQGNCTPGGWMDRRRINQAEYDGNWLHRLALKGIFLFSNFSLNLSKRYTRLMGAKVADDLLGTEPFFAAMPTKHGDPVLAKQAVWYVQERVSASNLKSALVEGTKIALIRNEVTMKQAYVSNATMFEGPATIAVGPWRYETPQGDRTFGAGEPIVTPKGQYIYQKDDIIADPKVQGLLRLKKEPGFTFRYNLDDNFQHFPSIRQTLTGYEGLESQPVDWRDFLCPLTAPTVHKADINIHLLDESHDKLKMTFGSFSVSQNYMNLPFESGEKSARQEKGEQVEAATSKVLNNVYVADCYMRFNPFEGSDQDIGQESEVWVIIDVNARKAIWYDYLGNHMPKRPFEVIVGIEKVANRWYGVGVFEMLEHKQLYVDTQFNRVNFKSSKSSSVRFRVKNAVAQWKAGQKIVVGDDQIFDVEDPRYDAKNPPLYQVNLTDIDEYAMRLIELMIQAGSNEVGIVGPDDGQMAGLDTTKLATGIKSLERTGNLLMKRTESDQAEGITAVLDQGTDIILEHMDEDEVIWHEDSEALVQLNREEVRNLKKSVRLLLTRSRSTETVELGRMVVQLCREFYEALNPYEQYKLRDEYVRQLKALEVQDADGLLDEVTKQQAEAWVQAQKENKQDLTPKTSLASKIPIYPSEREQFIRREGITPASPAEIQQEDARQNQLEVSKAAQIAKAKEGRGKSKNQTNAR